MNVNCWVAHVGRCVALISLTTVSFRLAGMIGRTAAAQTTQDAAASFGGGNMVVERWGCIDGVQAYSLQGGLANLGDAPLYGEFSGEHALWSSNAYRLYNNRFEQIGMSWIKHDDWSTESQPNRECGGGRYSCHSETDYALDVGCSDIYGACTNGLFTYDSNLILGPRSQINAWTGAWPVVPSPDPGRYCTEISGSTGITACRLQIAKADMNSSTYSGASYFLEQQVIHPDELPAQRYNNVSYKPATIGSCSGGCSGVLSCSNTESRSCTDCDGCVYELKVGIGACTTGANCNDYDDCTEDICFNGVCSHSCTTTYGDECESSEECDDSDACTNDGCVNTSFNPQDPSFVCEYTCQDSCAHCCGEPAIKVWKKADASVVETEFQALDEYDDPTDGKFILAAKAWNVSGCVYQYEYALYNMNSDRAADGFSVPLPSGLSSAELAAITSSAGFHDISYHSGEPYDSTDWTATVTSGSISWATPAYSPSENANALRWGTLYNFRFQAPRPPSYSTTVTIDLFKSGTPTSLIGTSVGPAGTTVGSCCVSSTCTVTSQACCNAQSGSYWYPGKDCTDCDENGTADICESFGKCCLYDETCIHTRNSACCIAAGGFYWFGLGTNCHT